MGIQEFSKKVAHSIKQAFKLESSVQHTEIQIQENINPQLEQLHNRPTEPPKEIPSEKLKQFKLAEDIVEFLEEHDPAFGYEPTTEGLRNKQEYVNTVFQSIQKDDVSYINRANTLQAKMRPNNSSNKVVKQVEPMSIGL